VSKGDQRDARRQQRRRQRQPQQPAERQRGGEDQRVARRQPTLGDGPAPGSIHERVDLALHHLVERRRSPGHERGGERDVGQLDGIRARPRPR
jgi:hypothetical protein